jgi:dipeptidyl aminopeptidase/acylaminoacyl peptidase
MNRVKGKILFLLSALLILYSIKGQTADIGFRPSDSGLLSGFNGRAQISYQKPPRIIQDFIDSPASPLVSVSPTRDRMLLIEPANYPLISDLSEALVFGLSINPSWPYTNWPCTNGPMTNGPMPNGPRTNGQDLSRQFIGFTLKNLESGRELKITVPAHARLSFPEWSPDGKQFFFINSVANGLELWIGNASTGQVRPILGMALNGAYANPVRWMPDSRTLVCLTIQAGRGNPPSKFGPHPNIRESYGVTGYSDQGTLQTPYDEAFFEYYATSQIVLFDTASARVTKAGAPAIVSSVDPSPDGRHLLVVTNHRPYSYPVPASDFPKEVEVWDLAGRIEHKLGSLPAIVASERVPLGPRCYDWRPTAPATLVWVEALDGGDSKRRAPHRDRILMLRAPFAEQAVELAKTEYRYQQMIWGEKNGLAIIFDRDREKTRAQLIDADDRLKQPRTLWSRLLMDRYGDSGELLMKTLPNGRKVFLQYGDEIYLKEDELSAEPPFLARYNLATRTNERLFQSDDRSYENVIELLEDDASRFITRSESPLEPPNYYVRTSRGAQDAQGAQVARIALTNFSAPRNPIKKQLVTYRRDDGQQLSFMLYLPPDYQAGVRLPTVLWVYPQEFSDSGRAGRSPVSSNRFEPIRGPSHVFFALLGYAVLDATVPIVGKDLQTVNDTYIEQIIAGAEAVVNKAVELGVTDRNRVGVGGHSYGAFMAVNLLAHSDVFKAGIARSGAYNRTLTPFGFQNERRTLWEVPELYLKLSPFMLANQIKEPLLLIHGEDDDNVAALQSERMYQAIKGNGGRVRYVSLPFESHGYEARESVEHVLWEMIGWFDRYVKQVQPASGSR